jgi:hypothetical protein
LEAGRKDGYTGTSYPQRGHANSHSGLQSYRIASHHLTNAQHGRSRSGNFRVLPPTSPGPIRSPTDISLAQLVPTDEPGEASGSANNQQDDESTVGLGLQDALSPPPDYTSPENSDAGSRRNSTDSENTPLIRVINRSRGGSTATSTRNVTDSQNAHPPIPSYHDAVQQSPRRNRGEGAEPRRDRSGSSRLRG